jgi:hypothetical protein
MAVNIKTIGMIAGGVVIAFGAIVVMNIGASNRGGEGFNGGVSNQQFPRQLPEANADPFQVISDEEEAARRATSNSTLARDEVAASNGTMPSYTAPPVIQSQGSSGDANDPMAGAIVKGEGVSMPDTLAETAIEPVKAPEVEYKVPERQAAAAPVKSSGTYNPGTNELLLRGMMNGKTNQGISINSYGEPVGGRVPFTIMPFGDNSRGSSDGAAGLPVTQLPDAATQGGNPPSAAPAQPTVTRRPAITLQDQGASAPGATSAPAPAPEGTLRTINPDSPASYIEGALGVFGVSDSFAAVSREHDGDYDGRKPYQVAQIALDNNSRVYDTSRNAEGFGSGSLLLPGDQRYATLMYGFNSDDAAQLPVFVQLHDYQSESGAFLNGARMQGTLRLSKEAAVMEFDKLILQDGRVIEVSAMGISADQLRVGIKERVNRHTLARYSSLLVSGLIQGVGDVGQRIVDNRFDSGSSGTTIIIGDGSSTGDDDDGKFTDADRAAIAMGAVKPIGDAMASSAAQGFNRKPTVTAPAGFGLSIVFLEGLPLAQVQ